MQIIDMMNNIEKKPYEAPRLTVLSFTAERGYAGSGFSFTMLAIINSAGVTLGSATLESYEDRSGWESNGSFWN